MFNQTQIDNIKFTAVRSLLPEAQFQIDGEGVVTFVDDSILTAAEITAEETRILDEWASLEYSRLREAAYAELNQDEMRFDDTMNGTTTWVDAILAIKALYPKPV